MLRRARVALLRIASPLLSSRLFSSSFPRELGLFIAVEELLSSNPRAPRSHSRRSGEPSRLMECTGGHLHSIGSARLDSRCFALSLSSPLFSLSPPLLSRGYCVARRARRSVPLFSLKRDATRLRAARSLSGVCGAVEPSLSPSSRRLRSRVPPPPPPRAALHASPSRVARAALSPLCDLYSRVATSDSFHRPICLSRRRVVYSRCPYYLLTDILIYTFIHFSSRLLSVLVC